jgi:hypothetical protein
MSGFCAECAEQVAMPSAFTAVRELFPHLPPPAAADAYGRLVGVILEAIELYDRCREDAPCPTRSVASPPRRPVGAACSR